MRPINADALKLDSWKTVEDAIFDIIHAPTMELSTKKLEKCMHYDTCKKSPVTMCGKRWWSEDGCMKEVPPSNADHIRSLSDEEWVASGKFPCPYMKDEYDECKYGWHTPEQTCEECILEWLEQPYKENTDD